MRCVCVSLVTLYCSIKSLIHSQKTLIIEREREREREGEGERETDRERENKSDREIVCFCVLTDETGAYFH